MSTQTLNIINKSTVKKDTYDILTFDTHERYQSVLAKTGHNFYSFRYENCKKWDETYAKKPDNYYFLPEKSLSSGINYDFILAQSKFGQLQIAKQIQSFLKIPIIYLEHTLPTQNLNSAQVNAMKQLWGDINVFISDYAAKKWECPSNYFVTYNTTDEVFQPTWQKNETPYILSVVNDFINRDYCCNYQGWSRVIENLPHRLVGNTPGLSEPAKSIEDLAKEYNSCEIFFNSSNDSTLPTVILEAMACGKPIVSTNTGAISKFVKHGINGYVSNDENELREYLKKLLEDKDLRAKFGKESVKIMQNEYSQDKFINTWNHIFKVAYEAKK